MWYIVLASTIPNANEHSYHPLFSKYTPSCQMEVRHLENSMPYVNVVIPSATRVLCYLGLVTGTCLLITAPLLNLQCVLPLFLTIVIFFSTN